ncbi:MAG: beta-ketoacyl-ACP synthase II [Chloroflexi bacterium]|nr:beta-ketoacyl-ACP synthase II [Chloroflexota bacterium]MBP7592274.1 beta-ketoacyl-ACP synthase II [Chloroflexota bacterium]
MNQEKRRVVITGMGTINPLGHDVATTWRQTAVGQSGIGPITQFDAREYKTQFAGEVKEFDPAELFGRKEARRMDRVTQFALAAAGQALAQAQLTVSDANRQRIGVMMGSGMGIMQPIIESQGVLQERGAGRVSPFFVPMMLADTPAALISIQFGLCGPNLALFTACASGNNALGEAARQVRYGVADVMLAGGSEACILPLAMAGFGVMGAISTRNDAPMEASRPFDKMRDGFVVSEGSAVLVLEALDHALARGAAIYGELVGYGTSADAYHISMPAEDGAGAAQAMRLALADAGLRPVDVDYINAHGTSTPLNDKSETAAIKQVFGDAAYTVPVSSTKSIHGHLLGATGALEAILCLQALREGLVPPTINYHTPDPDCDLDYVPDQARTADLQVAMSNTFGLGGHNATLVFRRWPA